VPPPPVEGAPTGTGLGDALGELITTGDVAGSVTGDADGDGDEDALAEGLELGATAVKNEPLGVGEELPDADAPPPAVQAVVAASTVRAPQPIAASLARPPVAGVP
jgi:hypothetical protein